MWNKASSQGPRGQPGHSVQRERTPIRSSVVPSAALYPKEHHHHRRCLTAFAKFCADKPSPRKKRRKLEKRPNVPRVTLWLCVRGEMVDSVSFVNDEIFNVKVRSSCTYVKSRHEFPHVRTCVARVLRRSATRQITMTVRRMKRIGVFLYSPDTLITPPQIN